jgi:hypothetical protein
MWSNEPPAGLCTGFMSCMSSWNETKGNEQEAQALNKDRRLKQNTGISLLFLAEEPIARNLSGGLGFLGLLLIGRLRYPAQDTNNSP